MLNRFMTDRVTLVKKNGQRFEDIPASVQSKKIFIDDASIPIEEEDRLFRTLSNGLEESYVVLDRGYYERSGSFKAHYQVEVRKETRPVDESGRTTIYNLHGANSRVNIGSHDASTNIVNVTENTLFAELHRVIVEEIADEVQRGMLTEAVQGMEAARGTPRFVEKYQSFIASAANHMTVFTPFLPALTNLLTP